MANVTVFAQSGTNFVARSEGVYIIKEAMGDGNDRYIVTRAIWVYEPSADSVVNDGWAQVGVRFADAADDPANLREAVKLPAFPVDGGGNPVQTP